MNSSTVNAIKKKYTKGMRVRLISMQGESYMPCGIQGTISFVDDIGQIHVQWDNGSMLALNVDVDSFAIVK